MVHDQQNQENKSSTRSEVHQENKFSSVSFWEAILEAILGSIWCWKMALNNMFFFVSFLNFMSQQKEWKLQCSLVCIIGTIRHVSPTLGVINVGVYVGVFKICP